MELSLCVVDLVLVLCCRAAVRRSQFSVDGCGGAAVLVVVGQRQVQQAGAGGQVDVLHVLHLRPTHGTQLRDRKEKSSKHRVFVCLLALRTFEVVQLRRELFYCVIYFLCLSKGS